jgi:putative component of membrane protein insertase Oxa1/YidC/SpoIIIJ protein YidD
MVVLMFLFYEFYEDLKFIVEKNQKKDIIDLVRFTFRETSESKLIATSLIRLYQLYVSSQDVPSCNFTLSCSRFGMLAIRKYGLFYGILMTSDRLQRCNRIGGRRYYPIDPRTGKSIDYPIETYYLGPKKKK